MTYVLIATDEPATVQAIIDAEFRLNELVQIVELTNIPTATLLVKSGFVKQPLDWSLSLPPVLLPQPLPFTADTLLALVYLHLDNWERVYEHTATNRPLADTLDLLNRLQSGVAVAVPTAPVNGAGEYDTYRRWHNRAVVAHYGQTDATETIVNQAYRSAIQHAPDAGHRAFTAKHFATLLADSGQLDEANVLLTETNTDDLTNDAQVELLAVQTSVWLQQLTVPYDADLLARTKDALWRVLQQYEAQNRTAQVGMLLIDAAQVANFQNSFAEALGYVTRAVNLFRQEEQPELLANAQYRKGVLLYTWAQNGNPQFYRPAMEAYQEALKLFTQQTAPDVFAEIQHHLGVIYAEIPDEAKKKSIWAAVSSSSFKHALAYYTRDEFPYEYATICNHFGNALTKYPPAAKSDNYLKAIGLYREALKIRTAQAYPYERALTILNYLEAGWYVGEDDPENQRALRDDMVQKAREVETLVTDEKLTHEARQHLDKLAELQLDEVGF
jgi:tetratricopeptide (TPR) repeat protein